MAVKSFTRWVILPDDREFVRVRSIRRHVDDAMLREIEERHQGPVQPGGDDTAAEAQMTLGFENRSTTDDKLARLLRDWRAAGRIRIYESEGRGTLDDADVLRGSLRRSDFRALLAEEWSIGLKEAAPTGDQDGAAVADAGEAAQVAPTSHVGTPGTPPPQLPLGVNRRKLIAELEHEWPTIRRDLSEASRNGLKADAHTGTGWAVEKARAWADSRVKISRTASHAPWPGPSQRHKLQG